MTFDEWYATQAHQLSNESVCRVIWNAGVSAGYEQARLESEQRIKDAEAERDALENVLHRNGFVRCDISACNCGSWHARYGLPERWNEIKELLADSGHPLCNENGNLALIALKQLVEERDRYKLDAERYQWLRDRMIGCHFNFDDEGMVVLCFEMPEHARINTDCDETIDAAMNSLKEQK